jgi:hypothetical protein
VYIPVNGGKLTGDSLDATVLPSGDYAIAGQDGYGKLDVRLHAETADGELLYIHYLGHLQMTPAVSKGEYRPCVAAPPPLPLLILLNLPHLHPAQL